MALRHSPPSLFAFALFLCASVSAQAAPSKSISAGELILVQDGKPKAEIVIAAENRPRMTTLAALELRRYVEKISGARLPIVTTPSEGETVQIYVGQNPHTTKLGIKTDELKFGAYRIVTGPGWLALLGKDSDFNPALYDFKTSRGQTDAHNAKWEADVRKSGLTESMWMSPFRSGFKQIWEPADFREQMNALYGDDAPDLWLQGGNALAGMWMHDSSGSLNAVMGFLNKQGLYTYMPGELGEVVQTKPTITLGAVDETSHPDFAQRAWRFYNYSRFTLDNNVWPRRVGMNSMYERAGPQIFSHWLTNVHGHEEMQKSFPENYALVKGERDTTHRGHGTACFSSEGLRKEAANFARFMYDHRNVDIVSLWPGDGLRNCQCKDCAGKDSSELVWGFLDAVARDVYKTHPDKFILGGAYTSYKASPESIKKFPPNVILSVSNSGRPRMTDEEHWNDYVKRVEAWKSMVEPGNLLRGENSNYHAWNSAGGKEGLLTYPVIHPRAMARDLKFMKDSGFYGEDGEQTHTTTGWKAIGLGHIALHVQSSFLWDADQNVDDVLDAYCKNFYGPAAAKMREVIDFAEKNLALHDASRGGGRGNPMNVSERIALKLRELLGEARAIAGDTIHGQRVQLLIDELKPADQVKEEYQKVAREMNESRAAAPVAVASRDAKAGTSYRMKKNQGSGDPTVETDFKVSWENDHLVFDVTCKEPEMAKLVSSPDVHGGDFLILLLETPSRSDYTIQVSPDGLLLDGEGDGSWKSLADVETEKGKDFWRVRLKIPVVSPEDGESDPLHRVAGSLPTAGNPWYFNLGRIRTAGPEGGERMAFSKTGGNLRDPSKFGKLILE